jgi:hypothetical protein
VIPSDGVAEGLFMRLGGRIDCATVGVEVSTPLLSEAESV